MDGRQTDDGPWVYYELTYEPSDELKKKFLFFAQNINFGYFLEPPHNFTHSLI